MVSVVLLLLSLYAGTPGGAVRVMDLDWTSDGSVDPEEASCLASLRPMITSTSFREFLRPIVDGTYRIRKKDSKAYLALSRDGQLLMSSETGKEAQWTLKRQKRSPFSVSMPAYTLRSLKGKGYLTGKEGALTSEKNVRELSDWRLERKVTELSHWRLRLGSSGKYYALQNAHDNNFVVVHGPDSGAESVVLGDDPNLMGWDLELVKKPLLDRLRYNSRKKELIRQFAIASELPVIPESNSRMTWAKMCSPEDEACQEFYLGQRERFVALGLLEEAKDSVVTEVTVSGLCDMYPSSLREMLTSRVIVQDLYVTDAGANCTYCKLSKYSRALRKVVVDECFAQCIDDADSLVPEILETDVSRLEGQATKCSPRPETNFTAFFEKIMDSSKECARLPSDTVEVIVEHVIQQRCWSLRSQDGLLWKWNDQLPQNLDSYNHASSCVVMHYDAQYSSSSKDIFQQGTCPEGTSCDCPETWAAAHETIFDIRQKGEMTIFVTEGSARLPSLLSAFAREALVKTVMEGVAGILAIGTATLATGGLAAAAGGFAGGVALSNLVPILASPAFIISAFSTINRELTKEKVQWRCAHSVGCWPVHAERKYNGTHHVCRMGDDAQKGRSPVWFMPPPGLQISMVKLGGRVGRSACKMKVCSGKDSRLQKVGFGGAEDVKVQSKRQRKAEFQDVNVYNCQPLTFGDMTSDQKSLYLSLLTSTGVFEEYTSPDARVSQVDQKMSFWARSPTPTI